MKLPTYITNLFLVAIFAGFAAVSASAQITITLPKFPKIKKNTTQTTDTQTTTTVQPDGTRTETRNTETTNAKSSCSGDIFLDTHLADLAKTKQQAAEFTPGLRDYYVQDFSDRENIYLKASLSASRRRSWMGKWPANIVNCMNPALDDLAAVARKTLPTYTLSGYDVHNPAEEKILRSGVNDIAQAVVFKTGFLAANWKISKDNFNFPTARYKHGAIWAKYSNTDDGFCRIIYVNLVQDYAGGGTYGASYGNFIKSEYAGCPPGK